MESKDWKERLKVNDCDWFGLSLFIDGEGVFNEYKAGGILLREAEEKLKNFIEEVREEAREEGRREYARELLDDYYQPDSDSIEIDVSEIQSELSKLTTK